MLGTKINGKWLAIGAGSLLFVMMLPSISLLAKVAVGLALASIITVAVKIASKTIPSTLKDRQEGQNQAAQQTTQSKIINLAIGLVSTFIGGLSLLIIAKTGLTAACAAVTALVLYECFKDEEIGKNTSDKLNKVADDTINFVVSGVEEFISPQSRQV